MLIVLVLAVITLRIFAVKARAEPAKEEESVNRVEEGKKCVPRSICFKDSDCGREGEKRSGACVGTFAGKCNCDACVTATPCSDDSACGGLKRACDSQTGLCDCIKGRFAGLATVGN
jgi:hypothetical protein